MLANIKSNGDGYDDDGYDDGCKCWQTNFKFLFTIVSCGHTLVQAVCICVSLRSLHLSTPLTNAAHTLVLSLWLARSFFSFSTKEEGQPANWGPPVCENAVVWK